MAVKETVRSALFSEASVNNIAVEFFEEDELARVLRRDRRTLRRWAAQRIGPPRIKFGQTILYKRSSVIEWLVAKEQKPIARRRMQ